MLSDQLAGTGGQSCSSRKNGCVRIRQPMEKSLRSSAPAWRYLAIRLRIPVSVVAPLAMPNDSHSKLRG